MGTYLFTTTMILVWCQILSIIWIVALYSRRRFHEPPRSSSVYQFHIPAIVLAPLTVLCFYSAFGWNLHFPVTFSVNTTQLALASFIPALVLCIASGLFTTARRSLHSEWSTWKQKPFALAATALGQDPHQKLKRLVVFKTWMDSWNQCLPWVFGELLIIEAIFNAPGLGFDTWEMAKMRDYSGLSTSLAALGCLYLLFYGLQTLGSYWLGKRLESYA